MRATFSRGGIIAEDRGLEQLILWGAGVGLGEGLYCEGRHKGAE